MPNQIRLQFEPNQDYQLDAISSVVALFDGLPRREIEFTLGDEIVSNFPPGKDLNESELYDNVLAVQDKNDPKHTLIPRSMTGLDVEEGIVLEGAGNESRRYPHFTIEMETGTGKTYVYLRTIYELRKRYGFSKFIIVVPGIAIYEGVVKNFEITKNHFRALYGNEPVNLYAYDSSQISRLRPFASSTFTEVMVITLDSFNKSSNVIYRASEKLPGERKPYQFIQEARPILILDEPQNMGSERAKQALRTLHPLFALRYSATHRESPNLLYRLSPFEAFRQKLVKKIQVYGVTEQDNFNTPFLALESISARPPWKATVRTYITDGRRTREQDITLGQGDNLFSKTHRDEHKGYVVSEIHAGEKFVEFQNGVKIRLDETIGPSRPAIFREQIKQTIQRHLELQDRLRDDGIKVLSLFFVDRVANYTDPHKALIRDLFDEEFDKLKVGHKGLKDRRPEEVRRAYFAKKKTAAGEEEIDTHIEDDDKTQTDKEAEKAAFELIMRQKEQLLSLTEPVAFIFAHSALKEGWDNPNVFQICTLNQTVSEMKKRQEIGRGLRLPVNQEGVRVRDDEINILTVVANQSYSAYASKLQTEYYESGDAQAPPVGNAADEPVKRNEKVFQAVEFRKLWKNLSRHVTYQVNIDTDLLIRECVERLNATSFPTPVLVVEKAEFIQTEFTLTLQAVHRHTVLVEIERITTGGDTMTRTLPLQPGNDLEKILKEPRLRGYKIRLIDPDNVPPRVVFQNGIELSTEQPHNFQTQEGQVPVQRYATEAQAAYPVPNLLDRVAKETDLTRPTVNKIFRQLKDAQKAMLIKNPEGFAAHFVDLVRDTLARHVSERIEFDFADGTASVDLDELFPKEKRFKSRELIPGNDHSLYTQVQTDSDIERRFVLERVNTDVNIIFYFKFPPRFKIDLPRIIGDYNPDWGLARYDIDSKRIEHRVRETKGDTDLDALRFPAEKRKIICAKKYFDLLGIDYRPVTADTNNWWMPETNQRVFSFEP